MSPHDRQAREHLVLRIVWMLLFLVVWHVAEVLLACVVVLQLLFRLITGAANANLRQFGADLSQYLAEIGRFGTFSTEQKPWPFADWPRTSDAEPLPPSPGQPL